MGWNNGKKTNEWKKRKLKEETLLRKENFPEDKIIVLRTEDLKDFNCDRRFYEHENVFDEELLNIFHNKESPKNNYNINSIQDLLDSLSDERLIQALLKDPRLLKMAYYIVQDETIESIAKKMNISTSNIYVIIHRTRKKYAKKKK